LAFEQSGVIWTVPANGDAASRVAEGFNPRWSAASDALYFLHGSTGPETLFRAAIDSRSGGLAGHPTQLR
jgi:hypothetical protein